MTLLLLVSGIPPPGYGNYFAWLEEEKRRRIEEETAVLMSYFLFEDYKVEKIRSDN
jgi:hypothetical protein